MARSKAGYLVRNAFFSFLIFRCYYMVPPNAMGHDRRWPALDFIPRSAMYNELC